jgi:TonB family protein
MRETFQAVRRRVLPSVVRQMYENAKTALEGGDLPAAKAGFESVATYLDALEALGSSELADLRVLSKGFLDLVSSMSKAAAPPEPVAAVPVREAVPPPAAMIHQAGEPGITPPVAISQAMPPWRPRRIENQTYDGVMTILIDENGLVTEVFVVKTSRPAYDTALRRAAAGWRFQPATVNGVPVKYRKVIAIRLTGEGDSR